MPDGLDPILLARVQFAFTVSFHFLFPAFSIGLASYLAVLEGLWLKTGRPHYLDLFRFWLKIFAVAFAMGVVSGIVMSYQFGTNWSVFSDKAGPVIGPLMAYEVLTAFFLEAGFLGVMLFGIGKVGPKIHFGATLMVAVGTFISAFWILSVNSWMQTPTGFEINARGQFVPGDSWLPIIFNPSFPYRLVHTVIAAYLTTALAVGAVGAWHLLRDQREHPCPQDVLDGDVDGGDRRADPDLRRRPARPQHARASAGQGHGDGGPLPEPSGRRAADPVRHPQQAEQRVDYAIEIPKLSSLILKHDLNAPLAGLDTVPRDRQPPVAIVFWSFRIMVGLGIADARPRPVEPPRPRFAASSTTGRCCTARPSPWGRRASSR